jgi:hypothetical protein
VSTGSGMWVFPFYMEEGHESYTKSKAWGAENVQCT